MRAFVVALVTGVVLGAASIAAYLAVYVHWPLVWRIVTPAVLLLLVAGVLWYTLRRKSEHMRLQEEEEVAATAFQKLHKEFEAVRSRSKGDDGLDVGIR